MKHGGGAQKGNPLRILWLGHLGESTEEGQIE
jgi:hypothetical protein